MIRGYTNQIELLTSLYFDYTDELSVKTIDIPKGANYIFGSVVNSVLSVSLLGTPLTAPITPANWFGHYRGNFESFLPVASNVQKIYAGLIFGQPDIAVLHITKLSTVPVEVPDGMIISYRK